MSVSTQESEEPMKPEKVKSKVIEIAKLCMVHDESTGFYKSPCPYEINKLAMQILEILTEEKE
jgi:hypothetical protein